jgi:phosphodiesterase/alkaline phosphatase D-like protein
MKRIAFFPFLSLLLLCLLSSCGGDGEEATSSPGSAPIAVSVAAASITENSATLNGTVNPNGLATRAWFEYGTDPGLQTYASSPDQDAGDGTSAQPVSADLGSLAPGTTYHFRVCAENSGGYSEGQILSFPTTSPGAAPAVTTLAATLVGSTSATLNGEVNPNGLATDAWFEWGTSPGLDTFSKTLPHALGDGTDTLPVMATMSALSSETTYYYRVAASNSSGSAAGSIASFTTASISPFGVVSTTPEDDATDVPLGSLVTVTFNRYVEPATLVGAITVSSSTGDLPGTISYSYTTATATFTPGAPFAPLTDYTVTVDDKVKSEDGVRLPAPYIFGFRTGSSF